VTEASKESDLVLAARHVADARRIVARQQSRIAKLARVGCSTLDAQQTLKVFESTLKSLKDTSERFGKQSLFKVGVSKRSSTPKDVAFGRASTISITRAHSARGNQTTIH